MTERFGRRLESTHARLAGGWRVLLGIGDDAAVLKTSKNESILLASDMLIEGVHFSPRLDPKWIGWKALAVNLSDIAAMGGEPTACVVSLGIKRSTPLSKIDAFYQGLKRCAQKYRVAVVGGDTVKADKFTVDVAVLGTVDPRRITLRSGASVGDALFVTGSLGRSLQRGTHARFEPRLLQSRKLTQQFRVRAMMDLSDGLADGLCRIAKASGVGLEVWPEKVPLARGATWNQALNDGEDFELLFAVKESDAKCLPRSIERCPVRRIGQVVSAKPGVTAVTGDGKRTPISASGFSHF